ncbi:MAG: hypothetical protein ABI467_10410, partial [Kofleriaceae bacterium]
MDLYGTHDRSIPQKVIIILLELGLIYVSWRLLFGDWGVGFARWMDWPAAASDRRTAVFACNLVVLVRMTFMMVVLLQRRIPFDEAFTVPFAFAIYYVGFALLTLRTSAPLGPAGFVGIGLFVVGSLVNSGAEL